MREYKRSSIGERKPAARSSGGYRADKPGGRFGRDSEGPRFGARPEGRFGRNSDGPRFGTRPEGRYGNKSAGRLGDRPEGRFRREDDRKPLEMHDVVCAKCGRNTTVPFRPTSSKPVYCRDCFSKQDDSFAGPKTRSRPSHSTDDLAIINQKLDKIMRALKID